MCNRQSELMRVLSFTLYHTPPLDLGDHSQPLFKQLCESPTLISELSAVTSCTDSIADGWWH